MPGSKPPVSPASTVVSSDSQESSRVKSVGKLSEKVHGFVSGQPAQPAVQSFSGAGNVLGGAGATKQEMREARLKQFEKPAVSQQAPVQETPRAAGFDPAFKEKLNVLMQTKLKQGAQSVAVTPREAIQLKQAPVESSAIPPRQPVQQQVTPTPKTVPPTSARGKPVAQAPVKPTEQKTFVSRLKQLFSSKTPRPEQQLKAYQNKQAKKFKAQQEQQQPVSAKKEGLFEQMATWVVRAGDYLYSAGGDQSKPVVDRLQIDKLEKPVFVRKSTELSVDAREIPEQQPALTQEQSQLLSLVTLFIQIMMVLQAMKQQQVNSQEMQINPVGVLQYAIELMSASLVPQVQQQNAAAPVNVNIILGDNNTQVVNQSNHSDSRVSAVAGTNVNVIAGHGNAQAIQQRNGSSKTDFDFHSNQVAVGNPSSKLDQSGPKFTR